MGGGEVIIADKSVAQSLFGDVKNGGEEYPSRYRLLPCSTVSGGGMLEGYRCDSAVLSKGKEKIKLDRPILAISKTPLSKETPAIINPRVLE